MILDVNAFIGRWPHWPVRSTSAEEAAAEFRAWGIERAAICSTRAVFVNWADGNAETAAAGRAHPDRFLPFACLGTRELSHRSAQGSFDFDGLARRGFAGIRLYPQHQSYDLEYEPFVDVILEDASARAWPVLLPLRITMNWGMPALDPRAIAGVVTRHPKVRWILAGINYLQELQMAAALVRRYPGVFVETSCLMGFEAVAALAGRCGTERVLLGTGGPVQHGGAGIEKILRAKISDAAREAILGANAARLLGVEP